MEDALTIQNARAAAAFAKGRQRQILFALMGADRSLTELAELSNTPLNLVHYHIQRLIEFGLVKITGRKLRAGAPIKLYRATAESFFVPAELSSADEDLGRRLRMALQRSFLGGLKGVLYSIEEGAPRLRVVEDPEFNPRGLELFAELELGEADAAALGEELRSIIKRFSSCSRTSARPYLVYAALTLA